MTFSLLKFSVTNSSVVEKQSQKAINLLRYKIFANGDRYKRVWRALRTSEGKLLWQNNLVAGRVDSLFWYIDHFHHVSWGIIIIFGLLYCFDFLFRPPAFDIIAAAVRFPVFPSSWDVFCYFCSRVLRSSNRLSLSWAFLFFSFNFLMEFLSCKFFNEKDLQKACVLLLLFTLTCCCWGTVFSKIHPMYFFSFLCIPFSFFQGRAEVLGAQFFWWITPVIIVCFQQSAPVDLFQLVDRCRLQKLLMPRMRLLSEFFYEWYFWDCKLVVGGWWLINSWCFFAYFGFIEGRCKAV